jgi:hypothetical protein
MGQKSNGSIYYSKKSLENKYNSGEFDKIKIYLFDWVENHRNEISANATSLTDKISLIESARRMIEKTGSIHLPSEMADQIKEINKEVWYRIEEGRTNKSRIKEDWTQEHSLRWREARRIELLFIFDKEIEKIQDII